MALEARARSTTRRTAFIKSDAGSVDLFDLHGNRIGDIKQLLIEKVSGQVAYVILSFGGFLGLGAEEYAVPWNRLTHDEDLGGYRTDITEQDRLSPYRGDPDPPVTRALDSDVARLEWVSAALDKAGIQPRLDEVARMLKGWDSYEAPPVSQETALYARDILEQIMQKGTPIPQVVPSGVGGLQLEWHEKGIDLEIHITGPYKCELWFQDHHRPTEPPLSKELTNDFSAVFRPIELLTTR